MTAMKQFSSLLLCLLFALPAAAETSEIFASEEAFAQWFITYYQHPEPARVSEAFQYAAEKGWMQDPKAGLVFTGFLAGVFRDNPEMCLAAVFYTMRAAENSSRAASWGTTSFFIPKVK
jgi:hypothetical protein